MELSDWLQIAPKCWDCCPRTDARTDTFLVLRGAMIREGRKREAERYRSISGGRSRRPNSVTVGVGEVEVDFPSAKLATETGLSRSTIRPNRRRRRRKRRYPMCSSRWGKMLEQSRTIRSGGFRSREGPPLCGNECRVAVSMQFFVKTIFRNFSVRGGGAFFHPIK